MSFSLKGTDGVAVYATLDDTPGSQCFEDLLDQR